MKRKDNNENKNTNKKKYRSLNTFVGFILGMFLVSSAYLVYNLFNLSGIETLIRYIIMGILIIIDLVIVVKYFKLKSKGKLGKYIMMLFLLLILGAGEFFIAYTINKGLNLVDNISTQKYKTYKTSLVTMKSGNIKKVSDISSDTKIGRITDEEDIENYVLTKNIMKKDKLSEDQIVDYDDPITMLYELYEGKINCAFVSGSYVDIYKTMQKFESIKEDLLELDKYSKKMKVKQTKATKASTKGVDSPFTILLMGVDSPEENISDTTGLGDSLMVITFNPTTLNATIFSIPRDTFVPISCYRNVRSKITHAASGGDSCMITTIENMLDVSIDYYAKVNFRGLIKIVDALDGIDVDVPYAICESDETRSFDNYITIEQGMQHLSGKQALALSRNRKVYEWCGESYTHGERSDFTRGQNQQLVISAIINKAKTMKSVDQLYSLLDAVGGSLTTNMDRKQILAFYNVLKNIIAYSSDLTDKNNIISMQKLYLNGRGAYIQDGIMSSMNLYEYVPSTESLNAIITAMKVNLGLIDEEPNYSFSFSSDEDYEPEVIGADLYGGIATYPSLPDEDETPKEEDNKCKGANEEMGADGKTCVCKSGYEKNKKDVCVKKSEEATCEGANEVLDDDGVSCVCADGYHKDAGVCVQDETEPTQPSITCVNGTIVSDSCVCWAEYEDPDGDGVCSPVETSQEQQNTE